MTENHNLPPPFLLYHSVDADQQNELHPVLEAAALEATDHLQLQKKIGRNVEVLHRLRAVLLRDSVVETYRGALGLSGFSIHAFIEDVHKAAAIQDSPQSLPIKRYGWWPRDKKQKYLGNSLGAELRVDSDKTILLTRQRKLVVDALGRAGAGFLSVDYVNNVQLLHVPPHEDFTSEQQKAVHDIAIKHLQKAGVSELSLGPIEVKAMTSRMRAARKRRKEHQRKDRYFHQ